MDKKQITRIGIVSAIVFSVAFVFSIFSAIGQITSERTKIVMQGGGFPTSTTRLYQVTLIDNSQSNITIFTASSQNNYVVSDTQLSRIYVHVYLDSSYASNANQAADYTRVYLSLMNPSESYVTENQSADLFSSEWNYYDNTWLVIYYHQYDSPITLTDGTWTLTTRYDAFV